MSRPHTMPVNVKLREVATINSENCKVRIGLENKEDKDERAVK